MGMPTSSSPNPRRSSGGRPSNPASTITAGELALVCARYDIGEISRVERLKRGSGSSPKVVIETSTGVYILKRLAPLRADPKRVAFGHELQLFLIARGFPAPELIGTKAGNNSMLQMRGHTYELFRYIHGREDSKLPDDARDAGRTLALLHRTLEGFAPTGTWVPTAGTFHDSPHVPTALGRIHKRFDDPDRREVTLGLLDTYRRAAVEARMTQLDWKPGPFIHGDWHPGNMLFAPPAAERQAKSRTGVPIAGGIDWSGVVCVLDFDSARPGPRVIDVANGALQFAMARGPAASATGAGAGAAAGAGGKGGSSRTETAGNRGSQPKANPKMNELDLERYHGFIDGYHFGLGSVLASGERQAVPWLMVQALIAEAAMPIAITGRFGKVDPMGLLRVVKRKAKWISEHADVFRIGG